MLLWDCMIGSAMHDNYYDYTIIHLISHPPIYTHSSAGWLEILNIGVEEDEKLIIKFMALPLYNYSYIYTTCYYMLH